MVWQKLSMDREKAQPPGSGARGSNKFVERASKRTNGEERSKRTSDRREGPKALREKPHRGYNVRRLQTRLCALTNPRGLINLGK